MTARAALLLAGLLSPPLALSLTHAANADDAALRTICEPQFFAEDRSLLSEAEWAVVTRNAAKIPNGQGRLWEVTSPGGAVSYLWGTMHSPEPRLSLPPRALRDVVAGQRLMLLEYPGALSTLAEYRDYVGGGDWYTLANNSVYGELPAEAMAAITERLADFSIAPRDVEQINPDVVLNILLAGPCSRRLFMAGYPIQDIRVELLGVELGLEIGAIEPRDVLDELTGEARWRRSFRDTLTLYSLYGLVPEATATAAHLYRSGQVGRMMAFDAMYLQRRFPNIQVSDAIRSADAFLLTHRNAIMVKTLRPELDSGGVVAVVGAYHLPGTAGLVSLLQNEGYRVKPLPVGEAVVE